MKSTPQPESPHRLVVLPMSKSLAIAFQSIRVRFFRSMITVLSLVLAIAFFSFVHVSTDIANGLLDTGDPGIRQSLLRAGYDIRSDTDSIASSPKQRWLLFLSLLVCVVGIVNAQLMAVTERFREIGTMKCLGALDRFILRIFMLEAGIQGLAGASAGALLGALTAILNNLVRFGPGAVMNVSWMSVGESIFIATGTGLLLSLLGVIYPAAKAARMQPVEAMRTEY